jgi:hypothetical protein
MAFREVSVDQIKEALRLWIRGAGERTIAESVGSNGSRCCTSPSATGRASTRRFSSWP